MSTKKPSGGSCVVKLADLPSGGKLLYLGHPTSLGESGEPPADLIEAARAGTLRIDTVHAEPEVAVVPESSTGDTEETNR